MIDDMGIFRTTIEITPYPDHETRLELTDVMVDTGSQYTWIPRPLLEGLGVQPVRTERFETADGRIFAREVGFAMVFTAGRGTPTTGAFAGKDDMTLLGAFALEGLNLRVDVVRQELVPGGPIPVAGALAAAA
jgi:predicted aspartyl protease